MKNNRMRRRTFLAGLTGAASIPVISGTGSAIPGYDAERVGIESIIASGEALGEQQSVDTGIVETAQVLSSVYTTTRDESEEFFDGAASIYDLQKLDPDTEVQYHHIRPVLKMAFQLDDTLGVTVPKNRLLQAYWVGSSLTTIGGILKACQALGEVSLSITNIEGNPIKNLTSEHRIDFAVALLALVAELAFAAVPISFNFAWKTTRFATNRALYRVRYFAGDATLAVLMSVVHWLVRDAPKRLVEFLISPETFHFISTELSERAQEIEGFTAPSLLEIKEGIQRALEIASDTKIDSSDLTDVDISEIDF